MKTGGVAEGIEIPHRRLSVVQGRRTSGSIPPLSIFPALSPRRGSKVEGFISLRFLFVLVELRPPLSHDHPAESVDLPTTAEDRVVLPSSREGVDGPGTDRGLTPAARGAGPDGPSAPARWGEGG